MHAGMENFKRNTWVFSSVLFTYHCKAWLPLFKPLCKYCTKAAGYIIGPKIYKKRVNSTFYSIILH
jgi:hypothetical protein